MKTPRGDDSRPGQPAEPGQSRGVRRSRRLAFGWKGTALLVAWALMLVLWIQFAVASLDELEPQAAGLGAIVVAILFLGGALVWVARHQT